MTIEQTRDEVERVRARFGRDPGAHALALADRLNWLSTELAMGGDYEFASACTLEAAEVLTAHLDPLALTPGEEFRYAGIVAGVTSGLLIDNRADLALPLLDRAVDAHACLAHLAGDTIVQPTFGSPPPALDPVEEARFAEKRRSVQHLLRPPSPYTDDHPPVPFETPPGAFARPDRGYQLAADWSFVYWQLLCARARALATLGEKERALDDAVEALAMNLLGTELDYARMVSSADAALKTASLLVAGVEPEEGPLGW